MISVKTQRFMAERIGAKVHSHAVDHAPMITAPELVDRLILEAMTSETKDMYGVQQ